MRVVASLIGILLVPLLVQGSRDDYRVAVDAIFGVAIRATTLLQHRTDQNFLISPLSATVSITQLMLGAEGDFLSQLHHLVSLPRAPGAFGSKMDRVHVYGAKNFTFNLPYSTLHIQLGNLLKALKMERHNKYFTLKHSNAVFVNDNLNLNELYVENLKRFYNSDLYKMNFVQQPIASKVQINNWAAMNTNYLIPKIIDTPPKPSTAAIFANAVYFLGEWQTPFSDLLNRDGLFNVDEQKTVPVTYMTGFLEDIPYEDNAKFRLVALPYKNDELSMYIVQPQKNSQYMYDIHGFTRSLKSSEILDAISRAKRHDVAIRMPKMTLTNTVSILSQLQKFHAFRKFIHAKKSAGGGGSFRQSAGENPLDVLDERIEDFLNFTAAPSNIDELYLTKAGVGLRVDDLVQQVVFSVNEKGTEAAAITATTIDYMGGNKNLVLNRPFLFMIRHEATTATLFWGAIANPAEKGNGGGGQGT